MASAAQEPSVEELSGQQDYYVNHLAEVNETKDVVSTEDIFNKNGIMIVRKNARISRDTAQRILQHKLMKPLDQQVAVEHAVTPVALLSSFSELQTKYPDLEKIHQTATFDERYKHLVQRSELGSVVMQKLTVLQERIPDKYAHSILCGWFAALIATEMKLSSDLVSAVYVAGLTRDLGLLHIPLEIVNKSGELTVAEWRALQSHVVMGQMLMKNIKGISPRGAVAVLEHHERCNGSGYPTGKTEEQLDVLGQIVGMAESILALRMKQFAACGRNLRDALPYLRMNASTFTVAVYNATQKERMARIDAGLSHAVNSEGETMH